MEELAQSFSLMMEAGDYLPPHVAPWATWMQIALMALPLLFIWYHAARMLILAQLVNFAVAFAVFVAEGDQVTRLFGLGHAAWAVPMVLFARDLYTDKWAPYRIYAGVAALTIAISLAFDVRDVALWIGGDRGSTLVGLPVGHPLSK